jgi:(p)ppGpp synthase/HD superfamily hydrolase
MLGKAISIVSAAFEGKTDRGGQPYVLHCLRVMNKMPKNNEVLRCAAVMHDLIEDTSWTYDRLIACGFSWKVVDTLKYVTHDKETHSYDEYIDSLSMNKDARMIKIADLEDNSDITRLKGLRDKDFDRMKKYHKHYTFLTSIE